MTSTPITYRGATLMQTDMPGGWWTWSRDETDGHGTAASHAEASAQIDRHLAQHSAIPSEEIQCP